MAVIVFSTTSSPRAVVNCDPEKLTVCAAGVIHNKTILLSTRPTCNRRSLEKGAYQRVVAH